MPIYCVEAGNNRNDLLQEIKPYFVYAALNTEKERATEFTAKLKKEFKLQGSDS